MPRPSVTERARLYLAKCPPSISGSGGHNAAFTAAIALVLGFDLPMADARSLLAEWNRGCQPPWSAAELEHKLTQAAGKSAENGRGYLLGNDDDRSGGGTAATRTAEPELPRPEPPAFDMARLTAFADGWKSPVDLLWLANRSAHDPATINAHAFLRLLYRPKENVLVFTSQHDQGAALWPHDPLPELKQPQGVWFLAQPVDGKFHLNPRTLNKDGDPKMSRRSEESVTAYRYLVIESDHAPLRLWLRALVQLPLRIAALYTSGGRSIHALVRVDRATKPAWDDEKRAMKGGLVVLGADPKAMSAVRLTRLPGFVRMEKSREPHGGLQKLLYIQPDPPLRPLIEAPVLRDVEHHWQRQAEVGPADTDETGGAWIREGLGYYAGVSPVCRAALEGTLKGEQV